MRSKTVDGAVFGLVLVVGALGCGEEAGDSDMQSQNAGAGSAGTSTGSNASGTGSAAGGGAAGGGAATDGSGNATDVGAAGSDVTGGATTGSNAGGSAGGGAMTGSTGQTGGASGGSGTNAGEGSGQTDQGSGSGSQQPDSQSPDADGQTGSGMMGGGDPPGDTTSEMMTDPPPAGDCGITIDSFGTSDPIPTVGIVTWSATSTIDSAEIHFGPSGGELSMIAPVDLAEPGYQTYLLGMKGSSDYDFQVVATSGGQSCSSDVQSLETGPVANSVPIVTRDVEDESAISPGFIVTLEYGANAQAFIIDKDGDPVWWAPTPNSASAARIDWDSKYVWMVTGNPFGGQGSGEVTRVSIDGTDVQSISGTSESHHDLAPLPGGGVAILLHGNNCSEILELGPDLSVQNTIDLSSAYVGTQGCHANSILYHPDDDTYTVSDRSANLYVKIDRADGALHWQFGGNNPLGEHIPEDWAVNHGHHVLDNGNFLFFNNNGIGGGGGPGGPAGGSPVHEYALDLQSFTATQVFTYTAAGGNSTTSLGDVQRLPNGNTLVTYSNEGIMHEVDGAGEVVQVISIPGALGYSIHRESLYGEPPK